MEFETPSVFSLSVEAIRKIDTDSTAEEELVKYSGTEYTPPIKGIVGWLNHNKMVGMITELEYQFACFVIFEEAKATKDKTSPKEENFNLLGFLATLLIKRINEQSTCLDLTETSLLKEWSERFENPKSIELPLQAEWKKLLLNFTACHSQGPLLLDGQLLFLTRNYRHEEKLARYFKRQGQISPALGFINADLVNASLQNTLTEECESPDNFDWQLHAVHNSLLHRFSIITGGPGTGKTTTVINLLAKIIEHYLALPPAVTSANPIKIALAAPTGKAALRLTESLLNGLERLPLDSNIKTKIPTEATTIHRLLKPRGSGFFFNETNTLPLDVLILDEASMVDITMMSHLVSALSPTTQLVLLGDEQQLASVEAGNILAELCSPLTNLTLHQQSQVLNLTKLKKSYRFDIHGGIGQLSNAVINSDISNVIKILIDAVITREAFEKSFSDDENPVLSMLPSKTISIEQLISSLVDHFAGICERASNLIVDETENKTSTAIDLDKNTLHDLNHDNTNNGSDAVMREHMAIKRLFKQLSLFQILACVRDGDQGVDGINAKFEAMLAYRGLRSIGDRHFPGRPILITENAYHLGLFNGDIGIQAVDPETNKVVSYFIDAKGNVKKMFNQRLPQHESVYAMTVHKSQGSEFNHTLLVLPEEGKGSRLLSRELLYTAITRARSRFSLFGHSNVVKQMVTTKTSRVSGLRMLMEKEIAQENT